MPPSLADAGGKSSFMELTFRDYALDGTYDGSGETPVAENGYACGLRNMDYVAVSGDLTFHETSEEITNATLDSVRIGGLSADKSWFGYTIFYNGTALVLQDITSGEPADMCILTSEQIGQIVEQKLRIRLTFEYVNENKDVHITFSVNGTKYYDETQVGATGRIGPWMTVTSYARAITLNSIIEADTTEYDVTTLQEIGLTDATIGIENAEEKTNDSVSGTLENVEIQGCYKLSSDGNMIFFGGTWKGVYLKTINGVLYVQYTDGTGSRDLILGTIQSKDLGESQRLIGEHLSIDMKFAFVNHINDVVDVKVGIELGGIYQNTYHIQNIPISTLNKQIHLYAAKEQPLSYSSVQHTQMTLEQFHCDKITEIRAESREYTAGEGDLNGVMLTGYYTFTDTESVNAIYFGGVWEGLRLDTRGNDTLGIMQVDYGQGGTDDDIEKDLGTISSKQAGMKLTNTSIKISVGFRYLQVENNKAKVKVTITLNDKYTVAYTMSDMSIAKLQKKIFVWSKDHVSPLILSTIMTPSPELLEVVPTDFGVPNAKYEYNNGDLAVSGKLSNIHTVSTSEMTMNKKIFSADVQFATGNGSLRIGGTDSGWTGMEFRRMDTERFLFCNAENPDAINRTINITTAGLNSTEELFNLKVTFEYLDYDGDGEKDDVQYGLWFNDRLYDDTYFYSINNASTYGMYLGVYCPDGASVAVSSPQHTVSDHAEPYILEDFGLKTQTYDSGSDGKVVSVDMRDISLRGRIAIKGNADIRLLGKGINNNPWEGYRFYLNDDKQLTLAYSSEGVALKEVVSEIGEDMLFEFLLTQHLVDADADGSTDDVCLGIWLNGELYKNRYFYLLDFDEYVQGSALVYAGTEGSITVKDSVDVEYYNLKNQTNMKGYLLSGKGTITVNQEEYESGDIINQPGDYIIRCANNGAYVKKVVLYAYGDAHPDVTIDVKDLIAIKKRMQNVSLDTLSGTKAADADANGTTDIKDYEAIAAHLLGRKVFVSGQDNYISYDEDVMPIGGFFGPYTVTVDNENYEPRTFNYLTDDIFAKIQDLGVNLITYTENNYTTNQKDVIKQLQLAEKYNIDVYLKDARLTSEYCDTKHVANVISDYIQYDSFKGIAVVDEPNTEYYGTDTGRDLATYAPLAASLNGYCNLIGNINLNPKTWSLMPNKKNDANKVDEVYEKYVKEYISTCSPKVLSTDYYVFDQPSAWKTEAGYFDNLEVMRRNSLEHGVTFWNFIQAGRGFNSKLYETPTENTVPTDAQLLWNVNTSLAYGAKGIQYFTLIQPYYFAYEKKNGEYTFDFDRNGLIGADGTETPWYGAAKKANQQIAAVDEVLMHTTSKDILAIGSKVQSETGKTNTSYGVLSSVDASAGAIVGVFDYCGKSAFYVVNYDYNNAQKITLNFDRSRAYSTISATGKTQSSGNSYELNLEAGGATLVVME